MDNGNELREGEWNQMEWQNPDLLIVRLMIYSLDHEEMMLQLWSYLYLIDLKIGFFCHFISYLWQKIAIVLAIFGHFLRLFSASDTVMLKRGAHSTWIYLTHVRSRIQAILGPLSHKSMAGRHQKWPIWDQKWPNMAGLPMPRCGPKGSQMVNITYFWPFGTFLGSFGPFWTF